MKLIDRELESRLRQRVRSALRASRALWSEYRRNRRLFGTQCSPTWLFGIVPILLIAAFARESLPVVAMALALYGVASAALRAATFPQALLASRDVAVLAHYPVSDADAFDLVWRKAFRRSFWTLAYFATFYGVSTGHSGRAELLPVALAAAVLQWLCVLSLALFLAAHVSPSKAMLLAVGLSYLVPAWSPALLVWVGLAATAIAVPVIGGNWPGLELVRVGYLASPRYAVFPIAFAQMARAIYAAALVRTLAWGPIVVGLAAHYAWRDGGDPNVGASAGLRAVYTFLTALPILVAVRISSGTVDMNAVDLGAAFRAWPIVLGAIGFAIAAFHFFTRSRHYAVLPPLAMFVIPLVALWLYRFAYDRGRIDLLRNAKE